MILLVFSLLCLPLIAEEEILGSEGKSTFYRTDLRVCPKCSHRNKTAYRYCRKCGTALKK